jgi:hypothetical protein
VNKEKPDREERNFGKVAHGYDASPSMMVIQGESRGLSEVMIEGRIGIERTGAAGSRLLPDMEVASGERLPRAWVEASARRGEIADPSSLKLRRTGCRLPIADCRLPIADCRLLIVDC